MKKFLLFGLIFCFMFFSDSVFSAPIIVGPLTIRGTIQEISWFPDEFVEGVEGMSGSARIDRIVPAHYVITLIDVTISGDNLVIYEGYEKDGLIVLTLNHEHDNLSLEEGMEIIITNYKASGDEGSVTTYYDKIEVLQNALTSQVEITMEIPAGWSMISLPVRPGADTVATLFPQAVVLYKHEKGAGLLRVQSGENLEVNMGYWIFLESPQLYIIKGPAIQEYTIPVADGWYMIGGCSMPAQKMVTCGRIDVIYGYRQDMGYQRLIESEPLEEGKGYWIKFSNTSAGATFTASTSSK